MKQIVIGGLVVLLLWYLAGCQPVAAPPVVETAHAFTLSTLEGAELSLTDLRGRWVLVNFWATWCLPCREEMAYLQRLADENPDDLIVLGVNMRESPAAVRDFVAETGVTFPILLHPDDATLLAYDVRGLPLTAVITPDGSLQERIVGPLDPDRFTFSPILYTPPGYSGSDTPQRLSPRRAGETSPSPAGPRSRPDPRARNPQSPGVSDQAES